MGTQNVFESNTSHCQRQLMCGNTWHMLCMLVSPVAVADRGISANSVLFAAGAMLAESSPGKHKVRLC